MKDFFTPINEKAFYEVIQRLPTKLRLNGRSLLLEILFRARRRTGWFNGIELQRGQFAYGQERLAKRCELTRQEVRTLMDKFKKVDFLTIETTKAGSIGTIIEFDTYIIDQAETNQQSNQQLTNSQPTANHVLKDKGIKDKRKAFPDNPLPDPIEEPWSYVEHCFVAFLELSSLQEMPRQVQGWLGRAQKEDRLPLITAACQQQYRKNWGIRELRDVEEGAEVSRIIAYLEKVASDAQPLKAASEQPPPFTIVTADGLPVTDYEKRLRRLVQDGQWTTDPDQGHDFTISDGDIARAKEEGVDSFLRRRQPEKGEDHAA